MPAGVPWPQYIMFATAAMLSMFAGSQTVHLIYRPLDDFNEELQNQLQLEKEEELKQAEAIIRDVKLNKLKS